MVGGRQRIGVADGDLVLARAVLVDGRLDAQALLLSDAFVAWLNLRDLEVGWEGAAECFAGEPVALTAAVRETAKQLESLFMGELMKSMRASTMSTTAGSSSKSSSTWSAMSSAVSVLLDPPPPESPPVRNAPERR